MEATTSTPESSNNVRNSRSPLTPAMKLGSLVAEMRLMRKLLKEILKAIADTKEVKWWFDLKEDELLDLTKQHVVVIDKLMTHRHLWKRLLALNPNLPEVNPEATKCYARLMAHRVAFLKAEKCIFDVSKKLRAHSEALSEVRLRVLGATRPKELVGVKIPNLVWFRKQRATIHVKKLMRAWRRMKLDRNMTKLLEEITNSLKSLE